MVNVLRIFEIYFSALSDTISSKWWLSAFSRSHVATRKVKLEDMDRYDSNNLDIKSTPRQPLCVDSYVVVF